MAFRLAESCITDAKLSAEEAQLWELLALAGADTHPDAHAVRLKLALVLMGSEPDTMAVPWDVAAELEAYALKAGFVSPACRLGLDEELLLLSQTSGLARAGQRTELTNRVLLLEVRRGACNHVYQKQPGVVVLVSMALCVVMQALRDAKPSVRLALTAPCAPACYDEVYDATCLEGAEGAKTGVLGSFVDAAQKKLGAATHVSAQPCSGVEAAQLVQDTLRDGFTLAGRRGFYFLYELLTGQVAVTLFPGEQGRAGAAPPGHAVGAALLRMLPTGDSAQPGELISILRALAANPTVAKAMPRLEPETGGVSKIFSRDSPAARLLAAAHAHLAQHARVLQWPDGAPMLSTPPAPPARHEARLELPLRPVETYRGLVVPRATDTACEARVLQASPATGPEAARLTAAALAALGDTPLAPLPLRDFVSESAAGGLGALVHSAEAAARAVAEKLGGKPPDPADADPRALPFHLEAHPQAAAPVAAAMLKRIGDDIAYYADGPANQAEPRLLCLSAEVVTAIAAGSSIAGVSLLADNLAHTAAGMAAGQLRKLRGALLAQHAADSAFTRAAMAQAMGIANGEIDESAQQQSGGDSGGVLSWLNPWKKKEEVRGRGEEERRALLAHALGVVAGSEPRVWFELLVALSMSSDAEAALRRFNPYLSEVEARRVLDLTSGAMLVAGRMCQAMRCLAMVDGLLAKVEKVEAGEWHAPGAAERHALQLELTVQADGLAAALAARRHFVEEAGGGDGGGDSCGARFDPRLASFEFMSGFLLRQPQVTLVRGFVEAAKGGGSSCEQMIMGGGKTTVITPLLALLLGDGTQLVMQCVPAALLEMSRAVMRAVFSRVLIKAVYTLSFDRLCDARHTARLCAKLRKARDTRAVVVCNPTSLKALTLKLVETFHLLAHARQIESAASASVAGKVAQGMGMILNAGKGMLRKLGGAGTPLHVSAVSALREEAARCVEVLGLFRGAVLLVDEVDLVLHPLKSELNWPLGDKVPLDMTEGRSPGLRWQLPWFLLDGLLGSDGGSGGGLEANPMARAARAALKAKVAEGVAAHMLQASPHLLLLSPAWYREQLKPLLAEWSVFWLRPRLQARGGLSDVQIRAYALARTPPPVAIMSRLSDGQVKLLNLTADWLDALLPHALSRIDRVHYGLLQPEELERAYARNPSMPRNRALLAVSAATPPTQPHLSPPPLRLAAPQSHSPAAPRPRCLLPLDARRGRRHHPRALASPCQVPFAGKDVPSKASEYAHPDVAIGLTTLAFRYEGLRRHDLAECVRKLKEEMAEQAGPLRQRPACLTWVRWVELAGARVRGSSPAPAAQEVQQLKSAVTVQRIRRGQQVPGHGWCRGVRATEGDVSRLASAQAMHVLAPGCVWLRGCTVAGRRASRWRSVSSSYGASGSNCRPPWRPWLQPRQGGCHCGADRCAAPYPRRRRPRQQAVLSRQYSHLAVLELL